MSEATIETAIWMALKGRVTSLPLSPELPFAWPGDAYAPNGKPYIAVQNFISRPARVLMAAGPHDRIGTLQLMLMHPVGTKYEATRQLAGDIAQHFPCDLVLAYGQLQVNLTEVPHVSDGFREGAWWQSPISIRWRCFA